MPLWLQIIVGTQAPITPGCWTHHQLLGNRTKPEPLHHMKLSPLLVPEITDHCVQYTRFQFKKIQFKHIIHHPSLLYRWQNVVFTPHNLNI